MPDQSSATPHGLAVESEPRVAPADWRLGGPTVARWRGGLLGLALVTLGIGIMIGALLQLVWQSPWAATSATAVVLIGMLVPVVVALRASRPAGLLRFRALDVLFGVGFGLLLRVVQGSLEIASGGSGALPSFPRAVGAPSSTWLVVDVALSGAAAPVIHEFFFRAVLLVALYTLLRRWFGAVSAGAVAVVATAAIFALVGSNGGEPRIDTVLTVVVLGLVCGLLVVLTGRIWGAVLVHVVFSGTFVALALAGTVLG